MKTRIVYKPTDEVRERHEQMLARLHRYAIPMPYAMGGLPRRSLIDNVEPHRQNNDFYMLDIKDAFPSVDIDELARVAHDSLYRLRIRRSEIAEVVDFIQTDAVIDGVPGVPMGYPASPFLFNLYCKPIDDALGAGSELRQMFGAQAFTYTRWLDDLTFSTPEPLTPSTRAFARDWVEKRAGFEIAHHKSRHHSIKKGPVTITGLSIYPDRRIQASPALLEKVNMTFAAFAERLKTGEPLTAREYGELNGYNSILHLAGDPRIGGSSMLVHLSNVHKRLIAQATMLNR